MLLLIRNLQLFGYLKSALSTYRFFILLQLWGNAFVAKVERLLTQAQMLFFDLDYQKGDH